MNEPNEIRVDVNGLRTDISELKQEKMSLDAGQNSLNNRKVIATPIVWGGCFFCLKKRQLLHMIKVSLPI